MSFWTTIRDAGENLVSGAVNAVLPGAGAILNPLQSDSSRGINHSGGPTGGSPAASAADPFASQRGQYQQMLQQMMGATGTNDGDRNARLGAQTAATSQNPFASVMTDSFSRLTASNDDAAAMLKPGYKFDASDPAYAFRLDQGSQNLQRQAAKGGMLTSGNVLTALQDYGQASASQEFGAEFSRKQSVANGNLQAFQAASKGFDSSNAQELQKFNEFNTLDSGAQGIFNNNYQRLSQLAGGNIGNPGQAGQILQQQAGGAAAMTAQWGGQIASGIGKLWDSANSPGGFFGGSSSGSPAPSDGGNPMQGTFSSDSAPPAAESGW